MEAIRKDMTAIVTGLVAALFISSLVDGREVLRVREIALAYGHSYQESMVVLILVVTSSLAFAAATLMTLSAVRGPDRKALVVLLALPLSLFACLPVYWYTYRGAAPGWHINIAEEHRYAQPAGVAAALIAYGISRIVVGRLRSRTASGTSK